MLLLVLPPLGGFGGQRAECSHGAFVPYQFPSPQWRALLPSFGTFDRMATAVLRGQGMMNMRLLSGCLADISCTRGLLFSANVHAM